MVLGPGMKVAPVVLEVRGNQLREVAARAPVRPPALGHVARPREQTVARHVPHVHDAHADDEGHADAQHPPAARLVVAADLVIDVVRHRLVVELFDRVPGPQRAQRLHGRLAQLRLV